MTNGLGRLEIFDGRGIQSSFRDRLAQFLDSRIHSAILRQLAALAVAVWMLPSSHLISPPQILGWLLPVILICLLFARGLLVDIFYCVWFLEVTFFEFCRAIVRVIIGHRSWEAFCLAFSLEVLAGAGLVAAVRHGAPSSSLRLHGAGPHTNVSQSRFYPTRP